MTARCGLRRKPAATGMGVKPSFPTTPTSTLSSFLGCEHQRNHALIQEVNLFQLLVCLVQPETLRQWYELKMRPEGVKFCFWKRQKNGIRNWLACRIRPLSGLQLRGPVGNYIRCFAHSVLRVDGLNELLTNR